MFDVGLFQESCHPYDEGNGPAKYQRHQFDGNSEVSPRQPKVSENESQSISINIASVKWWEILSNFLKM